MIEGYVWEEIEERWFLIETGGEQLPKKVLFVRREDNAPLLFGGGTVHYAYVWEDIYYSKRGAASGRRISWPIVACVQETSQKTYAPFLLRGPDRKKRLPRLGGELKKYQAFPTWWEEARNYIEVVCKIDGLLQQISW